MTLIKQEKIRILELIRDLPVLMGKCDDGYKFIPWYELNDRLVDIEPEDIKRYIGKLGGTVEFSEVGMTILRKKIE